MENINYVKGLYLKKEIFSLEDDKCNILAMWGIYIESPCSHIEPDESEGFRRTDLYVDTANTDNFICHHNIDDTGYIDVYRIRNKIISWGTGEDMKLKWVNDLRVYISINESLYDEKIWVKVLSVN